jgi:hypothetical protein
MPGETTLEEAKVWLRARFEEGATCPCCNQFVKLYKRKLNSNMAAAMISLYHADSANRRAWVHLKKYLLEKKRYFSDAPALRHWSLIEEKPEGLEDGNPRAGYYRITELGRRFVENRASVIKHTYQYNRKILDRNQPDLSEIMIREALGDEFNYNELMRATPDESRAN